MKFIFKVLKKIVLNAFLLYGYNLIVGPLGLIIPINIVTLLTLSILGFPALFSFIIILVLVF